MGTFSQSAKEIIAISKDEVKEIQTALNAWYQEYHASKGKIGEAYQLGVDGALGQKTVNMIKLFQVTLAEQMTDKPVESLNGILTANQKEQLFKYLPKGVSEPVLPPAPTVVRLEPVYLPGQEPMVLQSPIASQQRQLNEWMKWKTVEQGENPAYAPMLRITGVRNEETAEAIRRLQGHLEQVKTGSLSQDTEQNKEALRYLFYKGPHVEARRGEMAVAEAPSQPMAQPMDAALPPVGESITEAVSVETQPLDELPPAPAPVSDRSKEVMRLAYAAKEYIRGGKELMRSGVITYEGPKIAQCTDAEKGVIRGNIEFSGLERLAGNVGSRFVAETFYSADAVKTFEEIRQLKRGLTTENEKRQIENLLLHSANNQAAKNQEMNEICILRTGKPLEQYLSESCLGLFDGEFSSEKAAALVRGSVKEN